MYPIIILPGFPKFMLYLVLLLVIGCNNDSVTIRFRLPKSVPKTIQVSFLIDTEMDDTFIIRDKTIVIDVPVDGEPIRISPQSEKYLRKWLSFEAEGGGVVVPRGKVFIKSWKNVPKEVRIQQGNSVTLTNQQDGSLIHVELEVLP